MRALLLVAVACGGGPQTAEEELQARKPRVVRMLDVLDTAVARSDEQKSEGRIDIDAPGVTAPAIPDALRKGPRLQVVVRRGVVHYESAPKQCQRVLEKAGFGEASSMTLGEVRTILTPCDRRYLEVIEVDEAAGREQYEHNGIVSGTTLSRAGFLEIFDVTNNQRVVSLKFKVHQPPPASITSGDTKTDYERLYRAADEAVAKLLALPR